MVAARNVNSCNLMIRLLIVSEYSEISSEIGKGYNERKQFERIQTNPPCVSTQKEIHKHEIFLLIFTNTT